MSELDGALKQVGVDISVDGGANPNAAASNFNSDNLSAQGKAAALAGVGAIVSAGVSQFVGPPQVLITGRGGEWQALQYAAEWNKHHPKFKFLFKVLFEGFPGAGDASSQFYYYAIRADKPKVKFVHTDANYYNFRTRVLTSTMFDPLSITFYDEIGNSVSDFFAAYLGSVSQQGSGGWGADRGMTGASSTVPYDRAYSKGTSITIEQIFGNGTRSNRYKLINPRLESMDFDDLSMDENLGSLLTVTFTYDALSYETVENNTVHAWGNTDLLRGGGTSGSANAGQCQVGEDGIYGAVSASGSGLGIGGGSGLKSLVSQAYQATQAGYRVANAVPPSLQDLVNPFLRGSGVQPLIAEFNQPGPISSVADVISRNVQDTLGAIKSGTNLVFGGRPGPSTLSDASNQTINTSQPVSQTGTFNYAPVPPSITSGS